MGTVPPAGTSGGTHQPLAPGTILQGRYRIERDLGSGAFGRVYLATDMQDAANPALAIKELLDHQFTSPADKREAIAWFKREVSTLLTLEHPGIPAIYGHWTAQATAGPFYLVMEYIPGKSLQQELQDAGGRVGWPQVVAWGIALGEVLAYLHSRTPPIIFRDIKPQNVLLDRRTNQPVLIDFGIARQLAQADGTTIGTPGYAPYEQWLGRAEPRSDLYALGALLHTLLTGRNPEADFTRWRRSGLDVEGAIRALFPPADTLVPAVPTALAQVLVRATAFDKDDRYPDAASLVTALRTLTRAAGPTSSTPGSVVAGRPALVVPATAGAPPRAVSPALGPASPVAPAAALPARVAAAGPAPPAIATGHPGPPVTAPPAPAPAQPVPAPALRRYVNAQTLGPTLQPPSPAALHRSQQPGKTYTMTTQQQHLSPQQLLTDTVTKAGFALGATNGLDATDGLPNDQGRRYLVSWPATPLNEYRIFVKPQHTPRWGTWHTIVVTQYWVRAYLMSSANGWEPRTEQIPYGTINELMGHLHRLVNEKFSAWDWL